MADIGDDMSVMEDGKLYKCKVVGRRGEEIQVHFVNWNARYDQWLHEDSPRIVGDSGDVASCSQASGGRGVRLASKRDRDEDDDLESSEMIYNLRKRPSIAVECASNGGASLDLQSSGAGPSGCADGGRAGADAAAGTSISLGSSPVNNPVAASGTGAPSCSRASSSYASNCALCCSLIVGGRFVRCGDCDKVFHADSLCLGVGQSVIDVLLGENSCAVKYVCCGCRAGGVKSDSSGNGNFDQVLNIIGGLVSDMRKLTESVSKLQGGINSDNVRVVDSSGSSEQNAGVDRNVVMLEVREMYEREKRKSSIILRGIGNVTVQQASGIFRDMCQYLGLGNTSLIDIVKVAPSIYRGKILDNEVRFRLLAEARKLRNSQNLENSTFRRT